LIAAFARTLICQTCGAEILCRHCSVPLTYHKASGRLVCHYCGYSEPKPEACPECGSLDLTWASYGTERIDEELDEHFPGLRHARLDTDTASAKGVLEATLKAFEQREIDLLVGTQMVAKGLNFPGVRVVGILMADQGLSMPDFRAAERVFSLIVQVAGRAGATAPTASSLFKPENPRAPSFASPRQAMSQAFLNESSKPADSSTFPQRRASAAWYSAPAPSAMRGMRPRHARPLPAASLRIQRSRTSTCSVHPSVHSPSSPTTIAISSYSARTDFRRFSALSAYFDTASSLPLRSMSKSMWTPCR